MNQEDMECTLRAADPEKNFKSLKQEGVTDSYDIHVILKIKIRVVFYGKKETKYDGNCFQIKPIHDIIRK